MNTQATMKSTMKSTAEEIQEVSKEECLELINELGINVHNFKSVPELGLTHAFLEHQGESIVVPDQFFTVASWDNFDTITPLKCVSKQYKIVSHFNALGQTLKAIKQLPEFGLPTVDIRIRNNGARLMAKILFPETKEILPKDIIQPQIVMENSGDLSKKFCFLAGAFRLVCTNGMIIPDSRFPNHTKIKQLHKTGVVDLVSAIDSMKFTLENFSVATEMWKSYDERILSISEYETILEEIEIGERAKESIMGSSLRGFGGNLVNEKSFSMWKGYNGVTQYLTDHVKNEETQIAVGEKASSVFDSWLGK